jgi:hypothetical protein
MASNGFSFDTKQTVAEAEEQLQNTDEDMAGLNRWFREEPVFCEVLLQLAPNVENKPKYRVRVNAETEMVDVPDEYRGTRTEARSVAFDFMNNTPRERHAEYRAEPQTEVPTDSELDAQTGLDAIEHNLNTEKIVTQYDRVRDAGADMDDDTSVRRMAFDEGCHMLCLTLDRGCYEQFHDVLSDRDVTEATNQTEATGDD